MKYAIVAVRGFEDITFGASEIQDGAGVPQMWDVELELPYDVAYVGEFSSFEAAYAAAEEYYTGS